MDGPSRPSVIADANLLSEGFMPGNLPGREEQIRQLMRCLEPTVRGAQPMHLWIYGKPGSGKTATVLHVLATLNQTASFASVHINCWEKASFFAIVEEIVTQLRILRADEHRTTIKLEKLRQHLKGQRLVAVLDEIDRMRPSERSATLYNLFALQNTATVCISNCQDALHELDERARSRLNFYVLQFSPYSGDELQQILTERAGVSLSPDTWSEESLRRIAEVSGGDARIAISLLRTAANLDSNGSALHLDDLQRQRALAEKAKITQILNSLTEDHRLLYTIIQRRGEVVSPELWRRYVARCRRIGRTPLATRTFTKYVSQLLERQLISSEQARAKGRLRVFKVVR